MNARVVGALAAAALVVGCSGSSTSSSSSTGTTTGATTSTSGTTGGASTNGTGSGSTSGTTTGSGSTSGTSGSVLSGDLAFAVGAQLLFTRHDVSGNPVGTKLNAKLFGPTFSCTDATGTYPVSDFQDVEVQLETSDGSNVQAGSYDLATPPANLTVTVSILTHSANGENTINATAGTVNITAASPAEMTGTFSVTFSTGSLAGSFDAPYCH